MFTDDSEASSSQDRRCSLRVGDEPLCASAWRRAALRCADCFTTAEKEGTASEGERGKKNTMERDVAEDENGRYKN